jgi:hypothetical protein
MPAFKVTNWRLASNYTGVKLLYCAATITGKTISMLYQIYETQRSLMEPFADFAQAASKLYSNPLSPLGQ